VINKVVGSAAEALHDVRDGAVVAVGGFAGPGGIPSALIKALADLGVKDLTVISNDCGRGKPFFDRLREEYDAHDEVDGRLPVPDEFYPVGYLIDRGQVRKAITSFASQMRASAEGPLETRARAGTVEIELVGQGTLAERLRAARAGIAGFYTPVGAGTFTSVGKDVRYFDGVPHVLERALRPDLAIIAAHRADRFGNLVYRGTARTINPVMAGSAVLTVAQVDEIVPLGDLDPERIVTPGAYVDRVVRAS
jgi:3-oxoacid CoA-transferase A subunit